MSFWGEKGYSENLSFGKCPVCGGELLPGRMGIQSRTLFTDCMRWYSDDKVREMLEHPFKSGFVKSDAITYVKSLDLSPVPAGYCTSCKKIFAELNITDEENPIGLR